MARGDALRTYREKRRFDETPEPKGRRARARGNLYTIQKHAATRLHYDLRLELDGVLKSWAVTRGPSLDPADKRLAVRTEDHPLEYATFEGRIPEGNYGAGTVLLWDRGSWEPIGDPHEGLKKGKLAFHLDGERLKGRWALVRFRGEEKAKRENWLLVKELDDEVDREAEVTEDYDDSVASGRDMDEIAAAPKAIWQDGEAKRRRRRPGRRKPLPDFVEPQLARLVDEVPTGGNWLFEVKFDGYRAIAAVSGDKVRIHTRKGLDWTDRYKQVAAALNGLDLDGALLDGEIVAIDEKGRSNFSALQQALKGKGGALSFFVFDLLAEAGKSLTKRPLTERKARLEKLLAPLGRKGPVYFTDHVEGAGQKMLDALCRSGFEGVIAKRADAPYRSGRGHSWLKVKCGREQEFIILGAAPSDKDRPFSSLLLGIHEGDELRYAGRVGTGYSETDLKDIDRRLKKLKRKTPAAKVPRAMARGVRWAEPKLVAQIAFAEMTRDGIVRQGRFLGLREDKPAEEVGIERPQETESEMAASETSDTVAGVRLSSPGKVLFPEQGITKHDLASYLDTAADKMLRHAGDRLVSFVRCPDGRTKQCFFQRHGGAGLPKSIRTLPVAQKDGDTEDYLYLTDRAGLVGAAQMGVLEFHIWGCRVDEIDKPDRLVFDLDPDPSVGFEDVTHTAARLRDALDALGLESFAFVTGGKGVHVVAPLTRRHDWPTVKAFAGALAGRFAEDEPDRYVATMSKARRKGRIFIDHFRNERGSTAICPYSPRAREGAPLAWPVTWTVLKKMKAANEIAMTDAGKRLKEPDPWKGYFDLRQSLRASAQKALGL